MSVTPEERFHTYIGAFATQDYAALRGFYHPDVRLTIGTGRTLIGADAIVEFYSRANATVRRDISVAACFASGGRLAAELHSTFEVLADTVGIWPEPAFAGDRLSIESFALYNLDGDRYIAIRAAVFRRCWTRA